MKLNNFAITSFSTLGNGVSNFTAQNLGAGKEERVEKGFHSGILIAACIGVFFVLGYFVTGKWAMSLFLQNTSGEAMKTGVLYLRILSPFYFAISIKLIADGLLRGGSAIRSFMVSTFSDLILRVILAFVFSRIWGSIGIWLAWRWDGYYLQDCLFIITKKVFGETNKKRSSLVFTNGVLLVY